MSEDFGDMDILAGNGQGRAFGNVLGSGEFNFKVEVLSILGRAGLDWVFSMVYRSGVTSDGPLGKNWTANHTDRRLIVADQTNLSEIQQTFPSVAVGDVLRLDGLGRADLYTRNPDGTLNEGFAFNTPDGFFTRLFLDPVEGGFMERGYDGMKVFYAPPDADSVARWQIIEDRFGNRIEAQYEPSTGRLASVKDPHNRFILYAYNPDGRLESITDFTGREIHFRYDTDGRLTDLQWPRVEDTPHANDYSRIMLFTYSSGFADPLLNDNITGINAPKEGLGDGPDRITLKYDAQDRVVTLSDGGTNGSGVPSGIVLDADGNVIAGDRTYDYNVIGTFSDPNQTSIEVAVTDQNGNQTGYRFNSRLLPLEIREVAGAHRPGLDPQFFERDFEYNVIGDIDLVTQITYDEGNRETFEYDDFHPIPEGRRNLLRHCVFPDANRTGGDQPISICEEYDYEPLYNQPFEIRHSRGQDPNHVWPAGGANSPERDSSSFVYDYQQMAQGDALLAIESELRIGPNTRGLLLLNRGFELGDLGLGNINARLDPIGDDDNRLHGNIIATDAPEVLLVSGSKMATLLGSSQQVIRSEMTHDDFGRLVSRIDPQNNVNTRIYSNEVVDGPDLPNSDPNAGYLIRTISDSMDVANRNLGSGAAPTVIVTEYFRDALGRVVKDVDGRGIATLNQYNQLDQLVQVTHAAEIDTSPTDPAEPMPLTAFKYLERFHYDQNGNLTRHQKEDRGDTRGVGANQASVADTNVDGEVNNDDFQNLKQHYGESNRGLASGDVNGDRKISIADLSAMVKRFGELRQTPPESAGGTDFVDIVYRYDIRNNVVEVRQEVENTIDNSSGSPVLKSKELVTRHRYDRNGNRVLTILPEGNANGTVYDERDLPFRVTRGLLNLPTPLVQLAATDPVSYDVRGGQLCQCTIFLYDGNKNVIQTADGADTDLSNGNNNDLLGPGDITHYIYDGYDRRTSVIDAVGNQTVYQYDAAGNVVRELHFGPVGGASPVSNGPLNPMTPVSVDGVIQPANLVNSNILSVTEHQYDELSRRFQTDQVLFINTTTTVRTPDVLDGATDLGKGDLTPNDDSEVPGIGLGASVNPIGRVSTRYEFDSKSRLSFIVEDDEDATRYFYDGADRIIKTEDPEGNIVESFYDDNDNLIESRETDVSQVPGIADEVFISTNFYDALNRREQTVDNIGQAHFYRYDSLNALVAMADAQGPVDQTTIARRSGLPDGALTVNDINEPGNVTRHFYDGAGRKLRDEIVLTASGEGDGVHIGADIFGVKGDIPTPDPNQGGGDGLIRVGYTYDDNSLTSSRIDDNGNVTLYLYDNLNRRVTETKGVVVTTPLTRDRILGQREVVTPTMAVFQGHDFNDPLFIPHAQLDQQIAAAKTRLDEVAELFPSRADQVDPPTTIVFGYDENSNLLILEDENDTETFNRYDAINRLIAVRVFRAGQNDSHAADPLFAPDPVSDPTNPSDPTTPPVVVGTNLQNFEYDGLSRLTHAFDNNDPLAGGDDRLVTYAYDSLSRVIEENQETKVISSAWRADGLRSGLTYPENFGNNRSVVYTYDDLDRIDTIADQGATQSIADYDYIGGAYRILQRLHPINGTRMTYLNDAGNQDTGYDGLRRATNLRHVRDDNSRIVGFVHTYDRMNNKLEEFKLHDAANSEVYTYDSAYRLIGFERDPLNLGGSIDPLHSQWDLDGANNWTQVDGESREHTSFNEIQSVDGVDNEYDDNGNLVLDGTKGMRYEYDFRNRLHRVVRDVDSLLIGEYTYDAHGRRTTKVVTNSGALDGGTAFYYDGWRVIEERNHFGDLLLRQFVYGVSIDEVLVMDRNLDGNLVANGAGDQRLIYHQNTLNSVYALTDEASVIVEGYQYDAYGTHVIYVPGLNGVVDFGEDDISTANGVSLVDNPHMYTGRRIDNESTLYYYRTRYHDVDLGRFITRDTIDVWQDWGSLGNDYGYVGNRPGRYVDPLGQSPSHIRSVQTAWDIGWAIGTWIDEKTGLSDKISDWAAGTSDDQPIPETSSAPSAGASGWDTLAELIAVGSGWAVGSWIDEQAGLSNNISDWLVDYLDDNQTVSYNAAGAAKWVAGVIGGWLIEKGLDWIVDNVDVEIESRDGGADFEKVIESHPHFNL